MYRKFNCVVAFTLLLIFSKQRDSKQRPVRVLELVFHHGTQMYEANIYAPLPVFPQARQTILRYGV